MRFIGPGRKIFKKIGKRIDQPAINSIYMLFMKTLPNLPDLHQQIQSLQHQLAQLGPMRPGCLSRQYRQPKLKKGPYYQLSYTHQMKSRTEYIPPDLVPQIQQELAEYQRYRELTQQWIELSIEWSRCKIKQWKQASASSRPPA
jgi:hypothetical protein